MLENPSGAYGTEFEQEYEVTIKNTSWVTFKHIFSVIIKQLQNENFVNFSAVTAIASGPFLRKPLLLRWSCV